MSIVSMPVSLSRFRTGYGLRAKRAWHIEHVEEFDLSPTKSRLPPSLYKTVFRCYFATIHHAGEENIIINIRSRKWSTSKYDF